MRSDRRYICWRTAVTSLVSRGLLHEKEAASNYTQLRNCWLRSTRPPPSLYLHCIAKKRSATRPFPNHDGEAATNVECFDECCPGVRRIIRGDHCKHVDLLRVVGPHRVCHGCLVSAPSGAAPAIAPKGATSSVTAWVACSARTGLFFRLRVVHVGSQCLPGHARGGRMRVSVVEDLRTEESECTYVQSRRTW